MQGRFVFYNPQSSVILKKTLATFYRRQKSYNKYAYLLDYCINNKIKIGFCADGTDASAFRRILRNKLGSLFELFFWCYINKINPLKVKIYTSVTHLSKNDFLFTFLYGNFFPTYGLDEEKYIQKRVNMFAKCDAFKILHITHFFIHASESNTNIQKAKFNLFVAENDLKNNSAFYNKFFTNFSNINFYILPFVPQQRFKFDILFHKRTSKAVATGTLLFDLNDKDFREFYPDGVLHPMRKKIHNEKESLLPYIDSYISAMKDPVEVKKAVVKNTNIFTKLYGNIKMMFFVKSQADYFSFDIVALYNKYKMFIVPEEVVGLPGIGMVEGMACGSVYIGLNNPMYTDIGMIDGVNYIGYDGTIENLKEKISYYQNHEEELETIANNGIKFVKEQLNSVNVASNFINTIFDNKI